MTEKRGNGLKPRPKRPKQGSDVVLIQGVSEDGEAMAVLRAREDRVEAGIVRAVKEGDVPAGELIKLTPRPESPLLCDVQVELPAGTVNAKGGSDRPAELGPGAEPRAATHHGPAQVATPTYRANWDAIWNKPKSGKNTLPN